MDSKSIQQEIIDHPLGGPVLKPLLEEHFQLEEQLLSLKELVNHFKECSVCSDCQKYKQDLLSKIHLLSQAENHHAREELILHKEIEKQGIFGTQEALKLEYNNIKTEYAQLRQSFEKAELPFQKFLLTQCDKFINDYLNLVANEELTLYTTAIDSIKSFDSWKQIEIDFMKLGTHPTESTN